MWIAINLAKVVLQRLFCSTSAAAGLVLVVFCVSQAPFASAEEQSAKVLASKVIALNAGLRNRTGAERDEDIFRMHLLISVIRQHYPRSREALLLDRHRFYGIDIVEIKEKATYWSATNLGRAEEIASEDAISDAVAEEPRLAREAAPFVAPRLDLSPTQELRPALTAPPLAALRPPPAATLEPTTPRPVPPGTYPVYPPYNGAQAGYLPAPQPVAPPSYNEPPPQAPAPAASARRFSQRELSDRLRSAVVIVVTFNAHNRRLDWDGHGTGFFITDRHVLTNDHVVRNERGGIAEEILIANRDLGLSRARVLRVGKSHDGRGVDAALLEVLNVRNPNYLAFSDDYREGDAVTIAGFPGRSVQFDRSYQDFFALIRSGSQPGPDEIPQPKFSTGAIQSVFVNEQGKETLENGIETTGGNSGSPVVNACGFLVGQHFGSSTAIAQEMRTSTGRYYKVDTSKFNFSTAAREIARWLQTTPVRPYVTPAPCAPG